MQNFGNDAPPVDGPVGPPLPPDPPPQPPDPDGSDLPDPGQFDPLKQPFPKVPGIPAILEFKLDVIAILVARLLFAVNVGIIPALNLANLLLAGILAQLIALNAKLGLLATFLTTILTWIATLLAFFVIRLVVPLVRRLGR